ncbi:hypothetical protein HMPREF3067_08425 [Corynebacterium sp. HMSC04H06]|nr:hypothetical protein HMPREF3067_08425 [Corynebacterium sp. HMSC04H06]
MAPIPFEAGDFFLAPEGEAAASAAGWAVPAAWAGPWLSAGLALWLLWAGPWLEPRPGLEPA